MNTLALADKAVVILRRDLLSGARYRAAFLFTALGTLAELAAFYYLARAIGPSFRPEGFDYFSFLLVGTGFYTFLLMGVHSFLQSVQEAQQTGTFEVLMTTETSAPVLLLLTATSAFARNLVQLVLYVGAGFLIFRSATPTISISALLVTFVLSLVIVTAIGFMAAALQVTFQKGSVVLWALGSSAWLLTGTLFPVSKLPQPLMLTARIIPITHALEAMRLAVIEGAGLWAVRQEIAILLVFCALLLPLGLWAFSYSLRRARQEGTLSHY